MDGTSLAPISGSYTNITNDSSNLWPPEIKQPYTPPPREEDGLEADGGAQRPLSSNGSLQGGGMDIKGMRADSIEDLAVCASPGAYEAASSRRKRKKDETTPDGSESLAGMLRRGIVNHQLGVSLNLLLLVGMSWCLFPSLRDKLAALFWLSYRTERDGTGVMYGQGPRDLYFVVAFVVFFTGLRALMLDYVLMPLAGLLGISRRKGRVRFAEQSYLLLYYILYWNWGLYLFIRDTPTSLLSPESLPASDFSALSKILISLWTNFPRLYLDAGMKLYYLSQLAFWAQQIVVIHLEEKRKDHYQMLTHHFVTVALMSTSYGYRQWRVGNAVLVCMDVVDLVFPLAKILRYLNWQKACDTCFALFVIAWVAARHLAYLSICWSIYAHVNEVTMPYGTYSLRHTTTSSSTSAKTSSSNSGLRLSSDGGRDALANIYQPFWNPRAESVQFNARVRWGFLGLLLGLQCITIMWFVMICRVIARVLRGEGADDSRSDDEEDDNSSESLDDEEATIKAVDRRDLKEKAFIEIEAAAEDLSYAHGPRRTGSGSRRPKSKSGGGFATGLHLGDKKEILNRIGCLSEEQLAREREKMESRPGSGHR